MLLFRESLAKSRVLLVLFFLIKSGPISLGVFSIHWLTELTRHDRTTDEAHLEGGNLGSGSLSSSKERPVCQ